MPPLSEHSLNTLIDAQVFGERGEWEMHEIGGQTRFVKPINTSDVQMKARIASRFDELGFIPSFFREQGQEFVALDGVKSSHYEDVETAFVTHILQRI